MFGVITRRSYLACSSNAEKSLVVEQLLGVQIVCICHTVSELHLREKKKEGKKNKIEIFTFNFLNCERINKTLGIYLH